MSTEKKSSEQVMPDNGTVKLKKRGTSFSSPMFLRKLIVALCPLLRRFPIEIRGEENIPHEPVLFVCNHSNTHDVFVAMEMFSRLHLRLAPFVAWDGLSVVSRTVFAFGNAVFIRRPSKKSRREGFGKFCDKINHGENGLIFPESTWNLHPVRPMQKLNAGFIRVALATRVPVVPIILEYIEIPELCRKESELYSQCVVTFGKPIYPSMEKDLYEQADAVYVIMSDMRKALWEEFGIDKTSLDAIDRELYLNHLDMKKNHAFGFKYDTIGELRFLLDKENEYFVNQQGEFVPVCLE